jgi:hypothetical protein
MQSAVILTCWQIGLRVSSTKRVTKLAEPLAMVTHRSSGRPDRPPIVWQTGPRGTGPRADRLADRIVARKLIVWQTHRLTLNVWQTGSRHAGYGLAGGLTRQRAHADRLADGFTASGLTQIVWQTGSRGMGDRVFPE